MKLSGPGRESGPLLTEEEWTVIIRKEVKERGESNEYRGHQP